MQILLLLFLILLLNKSSEDGTKIKYDGRDFKVLLTMSIVSAIFMAVGIFCMLSEVRGTEVIMLSGIYVGGGLFLFSFINLVTGFCYLRRLKAYGYEIPYKKGDYDNDLRNVPRADTIVRPKIENIGSRLLCYCYAVVFLLANAWNIRYVRLWYPCLDHSVIVVACVMILFDLFWGISAYLFYRQADTKKYRDDAEPDDGRKKRKPVEKGIVEGIILLGIMIVVKMLTVQFSEFMFQSRAAYDRDSLRTISSCIGAVVMAESVDRTSDFYTQMGEGCYITDWGEPTDDFSRRIAECLDVSDFTELEEKFYTSDGAPRIYVKISEDGVYVRMDNPLRPDHGTRNSYEVGNPD